MKANEAPEKLYLLPNGLISYCRNTDEDIEYIQTDAFIEKATLWLLTNASDYCNLHNSYNTKEFVEDFVTAMKRE